MVQTLLTSVVVSKHPLNQFTYGFPGNILTITPKPAIILLEDVVVIRFGHRSREQRIFVVIQAIHEEIFERGEEWNDA